MSSSVTTSNSPPVVDENVAPDGAADPSSMDPAAALRPVVLPAGYAFDEGILVLDREPFPLHFGGELPRVEIAYRIAGAEGAPVVAVLGGISAGRNVFKVRDGVPGWWDEIAGPGKALDTDRFRVLGHRLPGRQPPHDGPGPR